MEKKERICKMIKKVAEKFDGNYSPWGYYKPKKNKRIKNGAVAILFALITVFSFSAVNVDAASYSKTLSAAHSTTRIRAQGTYRTHEVNRWVIGSPTLLSTGGKGGSASKSGSTRTSVNDTATEYTAKQDYKISATDFNYNTTSATKTFTWKFKVPSNTWGSCTVS